MKRLLCSQFLFNDNGPNQIGKAITAKWHIHASKGMSIIQLLKAFVGNDITIISLDERKILNEIFFSNIYHPPTKLREGNVFTEVCLSFWSGGRPMWPLPMMHWTSLYRAPWPRAHIPHTPHPRHETSLYRDPVWPQSPGHGHIWWPSLETCSKLFILGPVEYWIVLNETNTGVHMNTWRIYF